MNLRFNKKKLILVSFFVLVVLFCSWLAIASRPHVSGILRAPFLLTALIGREINGLIFYHRNLNQNDLLKNQVGLLNGKLHVAYEAYLENLRLKQLLALKKDLSYKAIASRVIGRAPDNWSSVIIIDKGKRQGIKSGFVVMGYGGLVGRVIEAYDNTSKVIQINDPNLGVSGIDQRSRQEGFVSGTLGNSLFMKYLPKDADIKISDVIITSGLTEVYPKGIVIGTVTEVGDEFSGLSRYAIIKPAVNLSSVEEVLVIIQ